MTATAQPRHPQGTPTGGQFATVERAETGVVLSTPTGEVATPDGCGLCGVAQRSHGARYDPAAGMHYWTPPSDAQRKERMRARAAASEVAAMIPRRNPGQIAYWAATDRKHFGAPEEPGSTFTDPTLCGVDDVVLLAHTQRGGLDGDDREEFIARGARPDAFAPDRRYLLVQTPGTVGVLDSATLRPDTRVEVVRTKPGAPCSLVADVTAQPTTDYAVVILAPDTMGQTEHGGDMVITAFPGPPTRPLDHPGIEALEGKTVTVRQVRDLLGEDVWVNTRIRDIAAEEAREPVCDRCDRTISDTPAFEDCEDWHTPGEWLGEH